MDKEELLERVKLDKKISTLDISELNLSGEDYNKLIDFLEKSNIEIIEEEYKEKDKEECELRKNNDSYRLYISDISKYKIMNSEEEKEALIDYKIYGSEEAKQKLINSNLRLVVSIAGKFYRAHKCSSILDLIQEGNLGLIKAVEKYDITRTTRVSTYSTWWIRQRIIRAFEEKERNVRVPTYAVNLGIKLKRYEEAYIQKNGFEPTEQECIEFLGVTREAYFRIRSANEDAVSLDTFISEAKDTTFKEFVTDGQNFEDKLVEDITNEPLWDIVKETLTPREYDVILRRCGKKVDSTGSDEVQCLEDIGKLYSITRERVRQIQNKAVRKLVKSKKFDAYR